MKKIISLSIICLITFVMIACSNINKSIKYNKVYSEAFGFSTQSNNEVQSPPEKNIYTFNKEKDWSEFAHAHLNNVKISNLDFNNKKVIYLQVDWSEPLSGSEYDISNIRIDNKNLNVSVKKTGEDINVSANKGISFKYIIVCTIDKNSASDNLIPNLIISK